MAVSGIFRGRLGVAVAAEAVRAVHLLRGQIAWHKEVPRQPDEPLEAVIGALLAEVAETRSLRPGVVLAVGPWSSHLRPLDALAGMRTARIRNAVLRENLTRFFPVSGVPFIVVPTERDPGGAVWGGAIESSVVQAAAAACRARGFRLYGALPTAAALLHAAVDDRIDWIDGGITLSLRRDTAGSLREIHRRLVPKSRHAPAPRRWQRGLASCESAGCEYADAFGAAKAGPSAKFLVRMSAETGRGDHARTALATVVCGLSVSCALLGPAISAIREADAARDRMNVVRSAGARALAAEDELEAKAGKLEELRDYDRRRRSVVMTLAALTRAIDPPTTFITLQLDSVGGSIAALTPRAAQLLSVLGAIPEIEKIRVTGPVTQETVHRQAAVFTQPASMDGESHRPMERVGVRFSWSGTGPREAR